MLRHEAGERARLLGSAHPGARSAEGSPVSDQPNPTTGQGTRERVAAAVIGALFVAAALAIVMSSLPDLTTGPVLAAIVIGSLGVEALLSAARNRRCLLSRIGPLP
jgi:hypothetical protein